MTNRLELVNGCLTNEYGEVVEHSDALETWWELSYAQFLTVPRVAMQSMPTEWQRKMAELLSELDERIDWRPEHGRLHVSLNMAPDEYDSSLCRYPDPVLVDVPSVLCDYRRSRMFLKPPPI